MKKTKHNSMVSALVEKKSSRVRNSGGKISNSGKGGKGTVMKWENNSRQVVRWVKDPQTPFGQFLVARELRLKKGRGGWGKNGGP